MGTILKRFDRPSSRKIDPVKAAPVGHDAKSLHDSVAATLRMFREDDEKKAKKLEADAWERAYRANVQHKPSNPNQESEKKKMTRGDGRIFWRGPNCWIAYYFRGEEIRESANTRNEKVARKLLKQRLEDRNRPNFVGPKEERWTLDDMEKKISAAYVQAGKRSFETVRYCFKQSR